MKYIKNSLIIINLIVFMWLFNAAIYDNERLLKEAELVYFELAPVDPRSLMQGDYMQLRYAITNTVDMEDVWPTGYLIFAVNKNNIAYLKRFEKHTTSINEGERFIKYKTGKQFRFSSRPFVRIGAESYFFQEGKAELFEEAKYGGLKINKNGESILIGLYNEHFEKL